MRAVTPEDIRRGVADSGGVLRFEPNLVANGWIPPGRRLGLSEEQTDAGPDGFVCERWLASTTAMDGPGVRPEDGFSTYLTPSGDRFSLRDAVRLAPADVMGEAYARHHDDLGRLAKILDYGGRIPFHVHPPQRFASRIGRRSKDEAYYFPAGVDLGPHPESFLGLHPWVTEQEHRHLLLEEIQRWEGDGVLGYSRAYQQRPEEGFFIGSGVLHAPGTAVTIELQESSDTLAMFQALSCGTRLDKESMLFKSVSPEDRRASGEAGVLDWVDWDANGAADFHRLFHISPQVFRTGAGFSEAWILLGAGKFSGKRLVVAPGASAACVEEGAYSLLVWRGKGEIAGVEVEGGVPGRDELLLVHGVAAGPHTFVNTGSTDLVVIKLFGPDLNADAPRPGRG